MFTSSIYLGIESVFPCTLFIYYLKFLLHFVFTTCGGFRMADFLNLVLDFASDWFGAIMGQGLT